MENKNLPLEKEKDCWRKSKGTKDQPMIGKTILGCSKRRTNLAITWIDCRKAYDSVPHSWILECLDMLGSADNVRIFLEKIMKKWKILLNSNGSDLCRVAVNRGIFQRDNLSPLTFIICMILLFFLYFLKRRFLMKGEGRSLKGIVLSSWMSSNCLENVMTK